MSHPALIPVLESLPGWPEVVEPGLMDSALILVGIPVAVAAVITLFFMGPHWFRQSQHKSGSKELERA